MNTLELKNSLISKISQIEDNDFLQALKIILDSKLFPSDHNYSEEYNLDILKSEQDIDSNKVYSHELVLKKIEEWKKR